MMSLRSGGSAELGVGSSPGGKSGVSDAVTDFAAKNPKVAWNQDPRLQLELWERNAPPETKDPGVTNETQGRAIQQAKAPSADPRSTARPGLPIGFQPIEGPPSMTGRSSGSSGAAVGTQTQGGGSLSNSGHMQGFRQAPHSLAIASFGNFDIDVLDIISLGGFAGIKAGVKVIESAIVRPSWVKNAGSFVNWMKNLQKEGISLMKGQLDEIVKEAKAYGVNVRLDPPHPRTSWDVPHLNIGQKGQAHIRVPEGYKLPE